MFQNMYNCNNTYRLVEIPQNYKLLTLTINFKTYLE